MTDPKKIEFAPGCFDDFDGTQEELEQLMSQLQTMFENLSTDELESRSRTVSMEDLAELDPETQKQILSALDDLDNEQRSRRLN
jgi:PleD family two-component response regulator